MYNFLIIELVNLSNEDSHALVDFGEEGTAVIQLGMITNNPTSSLVRGDKCTVKWSDHKEYYATFIFSGDELYPYYFK